MQSPICLPRVLRFSLIVAIAFAFTFVIANSAHAVAINEIRTGQPGNNFQDYFELAGTPGESLEGLYYLVLNDSNTPDRGKLDYGFQLNGNIDFFDGYWLAANQSTFYTQFPFKQAGTINADYEYGMTLSEDHNVTHILISGFTCNGTNCGIGTDLDTNDDGVLDYTPWASVLDSVSIIVNPAALPGPPYYGPSVLANGGPLTHIYRYPNITGPWQIGPYGNTAAGYLDTPGLANVAAPEPSTLLLLVTALLIAPRTRRRV
jgi:uncharacterized protein